VPGRHRSDLAERSLRVEKSGLERRDRRLPQLRGPIGKQRLRRRGKGELLDEVAQLRQSGALQPAADAGPPGRAQFLPLNLDPEIHAHPFAGRGHGLAFMERLFAGGL
jgi:hypothetical protein